VACGAGGTVNPGSSHGIIVVSHRCQKNAPGTEGMVMGWTRMEVWDGMGYLGGSGSGFCDMFFCDEEQYLRVTESILCSDCVSAIALDIEQS